jgi:hypothetical protein
MEHEAFPPLGAPEKSHIDLFTRYVALGSVAGDGSQER